MQLGELAYRDLTAGYKEEPFRVIGECNREWQTIRDECHDLSSALDDAHGDHRERELFRVVERNLEHKLSADPPAFPPELLRAFF
jgi:hypothetical protein